MKLVRWGALAMGLVARTAFAQGLILPAGGAMHQSMAGTSTAVGQDAIGALYWNPAVISGLRQSEVTLGSSLIFPRTGLTSFVPAGAYGPLGPDRDLFGRTASDSGVVPTTALGIVYRPEDSRLTYGLGLSSVAAGGVNFPGDANNPLLAPTGPIGQFILGPQAGSLTVLQIAPTASYQVNDCLAVGFGPLVDVAAVSFDPAFFGPPSRINPTDPLEFPTGSHTQPFWGGGFRTGVTYKPAERLTVGFAYTSPQWFQTWSFNARDADGDAIEFKTQFTLPQIFSAGVAYEFERLLLAADVRWFDYVSTQLLGEPVVNGGAGWNSVWAASLGARYQLTDRASVQAGYLYNENPVPGNLALFNTLLPAIIQHTLSVGGSFQVNDTVSLSLAYAHGFENTVSGSAVQVLGTSTAIDSKYDAIVLGLSFKFGGPCGREPCVACPGPSPADGMPADALPAVR
jgi:long-chain fatty acid transport protein